MAKKPAQSEPLKKETRWTHYAIFKSAHGQKVVEDLFRTFLEPPSYQPGLSPEEVAWPEGKKAAIKWILNRIEDSVTPRQERAITEEK